MLGKLLICFHFQEEFLNFLRDFCFQGFLRKVELSETKALGFWLWDSLRGVEVLVEGRSPANRWRHQSDPRGVAKGYLGVIVR
jgi:hypothetical protein